MSKKQVGWQPQNDYVLVLEVDAPSDSSIVLPDDVQADLIYGVVVACGPGAHNKDGQVIPMRLRVGVVVAIPTHNLEYSAVKVELDGDDYYLIREGGVPLTATKQLEGVDYEQFPVVE